MTAAELPDRTEFWTWVWKSVRPIVGWVLVALGALALFLGWFGVSGQSIPAKQIPYLVSGGLVGIALIVMAGVFLATDDWRRQLGRLDELEAKVSELHALLTAEVVTLSPAAEPPAQSAAEADAWSREHLMALPTGASFHRGDCALIAGKPAARHVTAADIAKRKLRPCRVCEPPTAVAG